MTLKFDLVTVMNLTGQKKFIYKRQILNYRTAKIFAKKIIVALGHVN